MTNKTKYASAVIIIILLIASFYAGVSHGKKSASSDMANRFGQAGMMRGGRTTMRGGGALMGEIAAKDAESLTIKTRYGSSHFAFFSTSTPVFKSVAGSPADLVIGNQVTVVGTTNQDGSVSAQSIQVRNQINNPQP